ncbi:uncharacterized protein AB675_3265 [Cyphellophora attinorum]|uniref:C3H1-type domain-containing protein n=1 Tax=Cyphellophora attinorum TaxID=1664694 RepID=A0A0N1HAK2_9EURO|nr:uncharacterized protein AB675_3265 [Phialophora attinorum]KPI39717.1 hypothetical protein AB675_3265 [Phialophora attinorum]
MGKRSICRFFQTHGSCKWGDKCWNAHGDDTARADQNFLRPEADPRPAHPVAGNKHPREYDAITGNKRLRADNDNDDVRRRSPPQQTGQVPPMPPSRPRGPIPDRWRPEPEEEVYGGFGYCTKACRQADRDRHLRECLPLRSMSLGDTRMQHEALPGPAVVQKEIRPEGPDLRVPEQQQEAKTQDPRLVRRNANATNALAIINGARRGNLPNDNEEDTGDKETDKIPVWAQPVPRKPAGANRDDDFDEAAPINNKEQNDFPPWDGPTTVPKNPIKRRKPSILDNNNAVALEVMVADPFRRLRDDQLLIDSYRYRRWLERQHGVKASSLQSFLTRAETVSLLSQDFNEEEQMLLVTRAKSMKTDMIDTEIVESTYNDVQMPLQMRLFADQVVGHAVTPELKVSQDVWVDMIKWEDWAWAGFEWADNFAGRF